MLYGGIVTYDVPDGRPLTNTVTVTTSSGENDVIETDPEPEPEPECENPSGAYEQVTAGTTT